MEYIFGTRGSAETVRTKGTQHSNLTGWHQATHESFVETVTDKFFVVRKFRSDTDYAGNCYDWYIIDKHTRLIDKTGPIVAKVDENAVVAEDAICELSIALEQRLDELEDAACELAMLIAWGE